MAAATRPKALMANNTLNCVAVSLYSVMKTLAEPAK